MPPLHPPPKPLLAGLLALALAIPAAAKEVYRWVDAQGVVHYSDKAPEGQTRVDILPVRVEPSPLARLALERSEHGFLARAGNLIAGPIEVELRFTGVGNVLATPALPARRLLAAGETAVIAELAPEDPRRGGSFSVALAAVPGPPVAQVPVIEYLLPLDTGQWRLGQGFNGAFSHHDEQNRFAIDLAVDEGTPVLAARAGRVMQVESDFERAGLNAEKFAGRANHIRILHDDGSMAVYAHLRYGGVLVRPGQSVRAGQAIGSSGNTGFSSGPHLHFAVQINRGMSLVSVPFRMHAPNGPLVLSGPAGVPGR